MALLITGGAGFVGSHTCVELLNSGEDIVVLDNFFGSDNETIEGIRRAGGNDLKFCEADLLDMPALDRIFDENEIDTVVHFAGYKSVSESEKKPLVYYSNNLRGTFNLLETMKKYGCTRFVFSSSGTVYGTPKSCPISETAPLCANNPYASTKLTIESLLRQMYASDNTWTMISLRYFYAAGAHQSGFIGEKHCKYPKSLMSKALDLACKERETLEIGCGYNTPDGSRIRDYTHVVDLAKAHTAAIKKARELENGCKAYNLGTGRGVSEKELLETFKRVNGVELRYTEGSPKEGDEDELVLDPALAEKELGWKAERTIEDMCRDAWNFRKKT